MYFGAYYFFSGGPMSCLLCCENKEKTGENEEGTPDNKTWQERQSRQGQRQGRAGQVVGEGEKKREGTHLFSRLKDADFTTP